ncbi:pyruvate phosphate dikinase [candidate division TA06 bacterium SM1_40]|uniref:Pyruvate, phosphate dikinase n=1 Tax=candidate division TA06 bacterium SM1_40 TaxID=1703773 RepID=A0A0S8JIV5_UNCT6|nr:MAG: pyruvate phosphate dikinase [candidate division TA06 bacterium SM1_40]
MASKYVYFFGGDKTEGDASMKMSLGGKGANLAEMAKIGIPVPPGFTITCQACSEYRMLGTFPEGVMDEVREKTRMIEEVTGRAFGGIEKPLLLSVRSGAPISMPGMMDTVLNLGLSSKTVEAMMDGGRDGRFVYDSYRRLIQMFGNVVMGIAHDAFESILLQLRREVGAERDIDLTAEHLEELIRRYREKYREKIGEEFPEDPAFQLEQTIRAVFDSWDNQRAVTYRKLNNIPDDLCTAVNVQMMVFGNMAERSGTGVAFTRHPATGEDVFYGEYLMNAQGEDVVAGIRTPQPLNDINRIHENQQTLEELMPEVYKELEQIRLKLDRHFADMQDLEFTIEEGKLYILQTRSGKRTALAAVKIALDYLDKGMIDEKTALSRIETTFIDQLLHPRIDPATSYSVAAVGLPAAPGAAVGQAVLDAETAERWASGGKKVILVRNETTPEDIGGMNAAQGILTALGGMTSHAALVARGMGKPCIVGCSAIHINLDSRTVKIGEARIKEGDFLTLAVGEKGEVVLGELPLVEAGFDESFIRLLGIADRHRRLRVRANAETVKDTKQAREFGAEGIGLCRTEHMFFEGDRIVAFRRMILAPTERQRRTALDQLLPLQQADFEGIFEVMDGLPVTIRLLDPPLHEFLPHLREEMGEVSQVLGVTVEDLKEKVESLRELNPMLGHRGCRLCITFPEICEMQTRAIIGAAINVKRRGIDVRPEIMVPLVGHVNEFVHLERVIREVADEMMKSSGVELEYLLGTMIEVPRAALTADEIAARAEFFSFGTNDLTQMGFGFSRDDIGSFLPDYLRKEILPVDPFQELDRDGIGKLVEMACRLGREARPDLKLGICGEHGGDPSSIEFCHRVGLDYVSCSPFRVPIARLAAAQAAIKEQEEK